MNTHLLQTQLEDYAAAAPYPLHMPGHKRRVNPAPGLPAAWDVTEVPGVDDLHEAQGILADAMNRAAALWEGTDAEAGTARLVNQQGEVFEANVGDVEDEDLPVFAGPEGSAAQMLALHQRLQPALQRLDLGVARLELSGRGSWRADLDSGARLELGRGSEDELLARSERFVRTYTQVAAKWQQPLLYADLRHADGYAVRLQGVSTGAAAARNN